ncbi:hypothetical protein COO91_02450 [Nostoc flagelliforme CCNUN1]|uniref:Uncharacterized protein n=1 Tax=Nostoc flagelliforme CCNUN1 TaxID=2038116 RepID=A0A2K8SNW9_9NOSO|nr:hypothetical protein COO91_02450 [Nostoc flagelliforme CCNUN1]
MTLVIFPCSHAGYSQSFKGESATIEKKWMILAARLRC